MSNEISGFVVVGVDGSTKSANAVKWAEQYAGAIGADLCIVTSWQWAMAYGSPMMFDGYKPDADAQVEAEKAKASLSLPDERVTLRVEEGAAGPLLVAASEGALALVVGSHGHGAVGGLLLGSVSAYCVHHTTCPIVVVR